MATAFEIIRGDDQTVSVPAAALFGDVTGGHAYYFVIPKGAPASDTVIDPAAVLTSTLGPFASGTTSFDFPLSSQAGAANSSLTPVGTYYHYGRFVSASGKVTTFRFDSVKVEVVPPRGDVR